MSEGWRYRALDWEFAADYGRYGSEFSVFAEGIALSRLCEMSDSSSLSFVRDGASRAHSYMACKYTFAVTMPRAFMPGGYVVGVGSGEMPQEWIYDANSWRRFGGHKCDHSIRNVFGYNILNARHLKLDVGGQRLGDWIAAAEYRGRVEPLDEGLFLWTFQKSSDDKEEFLHWDYPPVVRAREELKQYNVFPWQRLLGR